jgi:glutamate synthase (NADPH/NADH) small chain
MMTSIPGVFAAGDIVRGASLVVWGIKDGRDVAEHIHNFIKEKKDIHHEELDKKELINA